MAGSSLMLHAGARIVERPEVFAVPTPEATRSWQPVPHGYVFQNTLDRLQSMGMEIAKEEHALSPDGANYFATMTLAARTETEYALVIGVRNSHAQKFPVGLAMGSRVFICDNLAFSAEVVIKRKHTTYVMRDLPGLLDRSVSRLLEFRGLQDQRIEAYKRTEITTVEAHDFVVRCVDAKAIANADIQDTLIEWRRPRHPEFADRTVWSMFNAVTQVLKTKSPLNMQKRTMALHGVADLSAGLLTAGRQQTQNVY